MNLKLIFSFPKKQYIQSSCFLSTDCNYAISSSNGFQGNGCEISVRSIGACDCHLLTFFFYSFGIYAKEQLYTSSLVTSKQLAVQSLYNQVNTLLQVATIQLFASGISTH